MKITRNKKEILKEINDIAKNHSCFMEDSEEDDGSMTEYYSIEMAKSTLKHFVAWIIRKKK